MGNLLRDVETVWSIVALAIAAVAALVLATTLPGDLGFGWRLLIGWLIATSTVGFLFYGLDKLLARTGSRRIAERALLALALFGGSPGALAGMVLFRHKTAKGHFRTVFGIILTIQILGIAWLIFHLVTR